MSIDFPKEEVAVIERWREINAFQRQVSSSPTFDVIFDVISSIYLLGLFPLKEK